MNDRFFLFILKNRVRYDLILIYLLTVVGYFSENVIDFKVTLVATTLSFLYLSYWEYLVDQKQKIHFFYNSRNLQELRFYTLKQSIKLSLILLPLVILACVTAQQIDYLLSFLLILAAFYGANKVVGLELEKKTSSKIVSVKNILSSMALCLLAIVVVTVLYSLLITQLF